MIGIMLLAAALGAADTQKAAPDSQWKPVQDVFGFAGSVLPGDVIRFNLPRSDLHVTLGGVEVKPGLALGGPLVPLGVHGICHAPSP